MGYIKEPVGVDFVVDPTPLTVEDRKQISDIIVCYKATGRKKSLSKLKAKRNSTTLAKKKKVA